MGILNRIFKIGQSEAHSALDKLEDPIKMTEQGIKDLKKDLDKSLQALAEIKAISIRSRGEMNTAKAKAADYEKKAMLLLQKGQNGSMDAGEADRLASAALIKQQENVEAMQRAKADFEKLESSISKLDSGVKKIRSNISRWENELKTLKARAKVSSATKNINKQMANIDSTSTVSMLERMKDKVAEDEALAESYGEIANESKSIDDELDKALESDPNTQASDSLAALKAKMGM